MKKILILQILLLTLGSLTFAQQLSTTTFSGGTLPNVGASFDVPIYMSNFPPNIYGVIAYFEYDLDILDYTGTANPYNVFVTVTQMASNRIRVEMVDYNNLTQFTIPDGSKLVDLQFTFLAGYTDLTFPTSATTTNNEYSTYLDENLNEIEITDLINGAVEGGYVGNTIDGGDWATAANWNLDSDPNVHIVPNAYHNVTVDDGAKGLVTISADAVANNVTIVDGGQLTLNAFTLTVGGNFLVNSGGSFVQNGTLSVTGSTSAERYIAGTDWAVNLDGWHFLSSPVASQPIVPEFTTAGGANYDFYRWDEPSYEWENQKNPAHTFNDFVIGKGYLVAYDDADTKVFSGAFNTDNVNWNNLTRTTDYYTRGWNLIGNPYPCALEWGGTNWSLINVASLAKIWDEVTSAYFDINPTGIIPAMNGLMVQVITTGTGTLTIPVANRTHNTTGWYKSENQRILLVAHDLDYGELAQQSVVRFNDAATEGYDPEFDCFFLEGYAPVFYSVAEGKYLSTNTLPEWSTELIVPFMFEKNGSSNFNIELAETIEGYDVFLKDLKENTTVNLTEITNYTFTSEEGDDPERFEILFGVVGIDDIDAMSAARVYSNNNKIIISNITGATNMDIFNIQGQMVDNFSFNSTGFEEIVVDLPSGIYMVRLSNSGEIKTSKVFVK